MLVLNRRGLNNFDAGLESGEDVELTEEYVILKINGQDDSGGTQDNATKAAPGDARIYGLWIFSEPPPSSTAETRTINAQVIKECAVHAEESRRLAVERQAAQRGPNGLREQELRDEEAPGSVPMDRQISLKELFGQQREQDDEWSVKMHSPAPNPQASMSQPRASVAQAPLQTGQGWPGAPPASTGQQTAGSDVLDNLFRKAGVAYQGGPGPA